MLGAFLYADACPHCGEELKHNTAPLVTTPPPDPDRPVSWPVRLYRRTLKLIAS